MALTVDQAEAIVDELANIHPWLEASVREEYSGRGMYGDTVVAIIMEEDDRVALGYAAALAGVDYRDVPRRADNMGLGVVIY